MNRLLGPLAGALIGLLIGRNGWTALAGAVIGWLVQSGLWRLLFHADGNDRDALMKSVFAILGRLAKADGRVSEEEIAGCEQLMRRLGLDDHGRRVAVEAFTQGKDAGFDLSPAWAQLRQGRRQALLFMDVFIDMALADGSVHLEERRILAKAAWMLGLRESALEMLLVRRRQGGAGRVGGGAVAGDPYAILGLDSRASENDIRRAFRKLISRHHPDKLAASGATPEAVRLAQQKTQEIIAAYERIKSARGMS